jgi:hypothetical protein
MTQLTSTQTVFPYTLYPDQRISVKLSTADTYDPHTVQIEYDWSTKQSRIDFNLNVVNGQFDQDLDQDGISLTPSVETPPNFPSCSASGCSGGSCTNVFSTSDNAIPGTCPDTT